MANAHRGEATLVAGEASYTVRFSINAICEIEELLDVNFGTLAAKLSDGSDFRVMPWRVVLWAALRAGGHKVSLEEAGEIMDAAGVQETVDTLSLAMQRSNPEGGGGNP